MALFTYSVLDQKHPYWANLVQKKQNRQFKLKFGTWANSNMQYLFAFFYFRPEIPFLGKFGPKSQIFSLS